MDPKPIATQPASEQPFQTSRERTRPSALLLLIPLFITALISGGVWTWLKSGVPKRAEAQPPVVPVVAIPLPASALVPAVPIVPAAPIRMNPLPPRRPKVRPPVRLTPQLPSADYAVPLEEPLPGPISVRATVRLADGGDPSVVELRLHSQSQWIKEGLHADEGGKLIVAVPKREAISILATAPGYAFATDWVDLARTPDKEAVLVLERLKQYQLDVSQLDTPLREQEALTVEAGNIWHRIEFSQKQGELHAMGKTCVCIMHPLGEISEDALSVAVPPADQQPMRCFFAMRVGEGFLVRPNPDEGWVVLRLREPGVQGTPLSKVGRRVVTPKVTSR